MTIHGDIEKAGALPVGWWIVEEVSINKETGLVTYKWRVHAEHGTLYGTITTNRQDSSAALAALALAAYARRTECHLCEWVEWQDLCNATPYYTLSKECEHHREGNG